MVQKMRMIKATVSYTCCNEPEQNTRAFTARCVIDISCLRPEEILELNRINVDDMAYTRYSFCNFSESAEFQEDAARELHAKIDRKVKIIQSAVASACRIQEPEVMLFDADA